MTVTDLVSTHNKVAEPCDGFRVTISVYKQKDEYPDAVSVKDCLEQYGECEVEQWFQTYESVAGSPLQILIEICIKIKE